MTKQIILLIIASVLAVMFQGQIVHALNLLVTAHNKEASSLAGIFSGDHMGRMIQGVIAVVLLPVGVGAVLSGGYYLIKKQMMPHTLTVIWVLWTILLTTLIAQAA
jgi:hypothetical protein